jgi:Glycosyl hydrolases family 35
MLRIWCVALTGAITILSQANAPSAAPQNAPRTHATDSNSVRGAEIVEHGGYPELRVDGSPFFIVSAAFFYYRIPRDQWEPMLDLYRSIGINTLDIYIPWNWHEIKEGEFDFDGRTNPRRDLRGLLALITQKGFKLIARPGPEILNEWRHGGYPGWLLERPEYKMDIADLLEGRYPPLDGLNARDAEAAARGWLGNPTHMAYARTWLKEVAKELVPYSSNHTVAVPDNPHAPSRDASGTLLFVQLGDDFATGRTNRIGPDFWRYAEELRGMLTAGGLDVPVFINPTDMCVAAEGAGLDRSIGVMGQWYMPASAALESSPRLLTARDASDIEFFTEELKTQPRFPPVMVEYQAGWYAPADDDGPQESPPGNTLLSSRLLIGNGIHGLNYFPLQDTLTPAGYSVPWANRYYRWNAALGPNGEAQPRLRAVRRNTQFLERWGQQLAASHKRADFGILYPLGAYPQERLTAQDILRVSGNVMRIERLGALAMLSDEIFDPEHQPVEQLLRDALLLLPVVDPEKPQFQLSERAQRTIVEYVRRGGTLIVFPARPMGSEIEELWKDAPASPATIPGSAIRLRWKFGEGEVIESSKDFSSFVELDGDLSQPRAQPEIDWAMGVLHEFVAAAGVLPSVRISGKPAGASELIASEIVTNEGTGLLGERKGGQGFLSVVNLSERDTMDTILEIRSPAASARGTLAEEEPLHVIVPPRESLLLPLDTPICFADPANAPCGDLVESSGAEFLDAQREGKDLELLFYVPSRAEIHLRLSRQPRHVTLDEATPDNAWSVKDKELEVSVPRGAAPDFLRLLKIDLPYTPHVPEPVKRTKPVPSELEYYVENAIRLPTSATAFLRTFPPLVILDSDRPTTVLLQGENHNPITSQDADISIDGPLRGGTSAHILPGSATIEKIKLRPSGKDATALPAAPDGLLHGTIEIHSGRDQRTIPISFLQTREGGTTHYRYDFDRDGADEWVLENAKLRLIVSPESGGRAMALVDKSSGANLSTSVGLLRDNFSFLENSSDSGDLRARGRYGLFNRSYIPEWLTEKDSPTLRLHYDAPDVFPSGARIEKTIQLENADTLRVDYRVALRAASSGAASPREGHPQSFVAVNSFTATAKSGHVTQFCWAREHGAGTHTDAVESAREEKTSRHCEDFSPGGKTIELPEDTTSVEIQTPKRPTIAFEWECARTRAHLTIEPKTFSALFRLEFPPLTSGGDEGQYTLRIRALGLP